MISNNKSQKQPTNRKDNNSLQINTNAIFEYVDIKSNTKLFSTLYVIIMLSSKLLVVVYV